MAIRILLIGAGAVGGFYASRLAQAPETEVSVLCRSNFKAVSSQGFKVSSPKYGSYTWIPHETYASQQDAINAEVVWDFIIISTKALPDVSDDSEFLIGLVSKEQTTIVLVQNGLGVEEPYARQFPSTCILSAVTVISAVQTSPGTIQHNRWTRISLGPYYLQSVSIDSRHVGDDRARFLVDLLLRGGIKDAEQYSASKLQMLRWHKIAINASMNPTAVLAGGCSSQDILADDEMRFHIKMMIEEVFSTAQKLLHSPFPSEFASADQLMSSFARNTTGSKASMLLDWEQGRKMELEVILGNPIRMARLKGIEMPRLQSVYALLKSAQTKRDQNISSKM